MKLGVQTVAPAGKKYDTAKTRFDLVPFSVVEVLAKVLTFGAEKYGANNWQGLENFDARYFAAMMRHLVAWRRGERIDPESGLPHLAHALCCLVFILSRELGFDRSLEPAPYNPTGADPAYDIPAKPLEAWDIDLADEGLDSDSDVGGYMAADRKCGAV